MTAQSDSKDNGRDNDNGDDHNQSAAKADNNSSTECLPLASHCNLLCTSTAEAKGVLCETEGDVRVGSSKATPGSATPDQAPSSNHHHQGAPLPSSGAYRIVEPKTHRMASRQAQEPYLVWLQVRHDI